eukprot:scaffold72533_cov33-Tisochrysis_lutea.AAC.4
MEYVRKYLDGFALAVGVGRGDGMHSVRESVASWPMLGREGVWLGVSVGLGSVSARWLPIPSEQRGRAELDHEFQHRWSTRRRLSLLPKNEPQPEIINIKRVQPQ